MGIKRTYEGIKVRIKKIPVRKPSFWLRTGIEFILIVALAITMWPSVQEAVVRGDEDGPEIAVTGRATTINGGDLIFNASPYHSNVVIDNITKDFDGYVWSEDIGWIAFGSGDDNPSGPVHVDQVSGKITGLAVAMSTGGVVNFDVSPYGSNVIINTEGVFSGFAWSEDIGWINFTGVNVSGISFVSPNAPSNVRIYDVSDRNLQDYAILLRWQEPAEFDEDNFNAYLVERSTDGITFSQQSSTTSRAYYDTNVTMGTKYYYRIKSQNKTGATEASQIVYLEPTGRYTTPPNLVSGPDIITSPTSIVVRWATDRPCSSFVQTKEGNTFVSEQGQTEQVTSHEVKVVGLRSQKSYMYNIRSVDIDGNVLTSSERQFTTANLPSIYDIGINNITLTSALINFRSTAIANFELRYGETANYGMIIPEISGSQTTNHSIPLNGLKPGQVYFFRLVGEDTDGNELRSDNSFSTLPQPEVTKFSIDSLNDKPSTTVKVTWKTNVATDSVVKYSTDGTKYSEKSSSELVTDHEVEISDMADNSKYSIYASGRDQFGNLATSEKSEFTTPKDSRAPKISNVVMESSSIGNNTNDKAQVVVSWKTDEPSTSQVEYGQGVNKENYTNKTVLDSTLTNNHLVVISNLDPGKPYHLRVISSDNSGNQSIGDDSLIVTGEVSRSALKIILNTLVNVFGWMERFIQ